MKESDPRKLDTDVRFLLANERTLLAWMRTAVAIIAAGLALTYVGKQSDVQVTLGIIGILGGALLAALGYIRFVAADKAIRMGQLPEPGNGPIVQVTGIVLFALAIAAVVGIGL